MDNKKLSLREEDEGLLKVIYATMTDEGRCLLMEKYNAVEQGELKGKTEAYHFQYYKSELFHREQRDKLGVVLKLQGIKSGIRVVEKLPTESTTDPDTAKTIFECFANAKDISQPECLLEFLELCDRKNFPLVAFENDESGLKDTIEDLSKYIVDSKNEANLKKNSSIDNIEGNADTIKNTSSNIERVTEKTKWLDPYNHKELPLVGRKKELGLLDKFAKHADQFKIWAIAGPSGAGKTRLAIQWAMDSTVLTVWDCRVLHKEDRTEPEKWANWSPDKPTLIIIDYMYGFDEVVLKLMNHRFKPTDSKVRLLLIDHVFSEPLHSDKRWGFSGDRSSLNRNEKHFFALKPLDLRQTQNQEKIIKSIIARRARINIKSDQVDKAHEYLLETKGAYHPLFAALIGDAIRSNKDFTVWNRRELIDYYLSGERLPWAHDKFLGLWASHFIAVATARRGVAYEDLEEAASNCASAPEHFGRMEKICQTVITDDNAITLAPFEPDILGESFFLQFLKFIKKSKKYKAEFRQVFMAGNECTQTKDAIEFIAFIQRLTRNLLNDDQNQSKTVELWDTLFAFMRPSEFGNAEPIRWALTAGLIDIVDAIKDQFPEEKLVTLLNQIEPAVLYQAHNSSLLKKAVLYSMHCFELTSKLTKTTPVFSEGMFALFNRYTASKIAEETPLMIASYYGFNEIINVLIDRGVDTKATFNGGLNALMFASLGGQIEAVKRLINTTTNIHATDNEGDTALILTSLKGHIEVAKLLLDKGAKIDAANNRGGTAFIAASYNDQVEVVKLLLDKGANINAADIKGQTALFIASTEGHIEVVKLLLDKGENIIDATDNESRTVLIWASLSGHIEVVKFLLDKGANINATDNESITTLIAASSEGHAKVAKLLLDKGANVDAADNEGSTALIWASARGHAKVTKLLLDKGANIDTADNEGYTALFTASLKGHVEVAKLLLDKGAEINITDNEGHTALFWASAVGHISVAKLLLQKEGIKK